MSQSYESYIGSQTSRISRPADINVRRNDKSSGYLPRTACDWHPTIKDNLLQYFITLDYPFRLNFSIPFPEPYRSEIRRFLISLDAYIESPNPVIPTRDILYGATDLNYAETLKRIKRKSFETTWNVKHFGVPDWWDEVPAYAIKDIGDIFNYSYLIFWKTPEPEDYKHGMQAVEMDTSALADFKNILRCILPDPEHVSRVDEIEVLSTISSSMSYNVKTKEHVPHYKLKPSQLYFADSIGEAERVILYVSPNNVRDSVLVTPAALNTISLLDKQVMNILQRMSQHIHLRDKDQVTRRLQNLYHNFTLFLQRDLRKEGITKPRELLKAMLEVLHETYPEIPIFSKTSFYDDFSLRVKGELIHPPRGHGLGMANSLTTLMQIVIHTMVTDRLSHLAHGKDPKCLCLNDDFLVGFEEYEDLENYWDIEDEVMTELSLLRAPEKSFQSERRFVLAERYFCGEEDKKISYQLRESLMPLACYNIAHAKDYFRSVQTYVNSDICAKYIMEIVEYWGYEFYKDEFQYPYIVGGWRNEIINAVDLSLLELEELDYSAKVYKGAMAALATPYRKSYRGDRYISPIMTLLGKPEIPENYWDHFDYIPTDQLNDKYGRVLTRSSNEFRHYWDSLLKNRRNAFTKAESISYHELILFLVEQYPATIFYPCTQMIAEYVDADIGRCYVKDIYMDPNPRLALVSKYNSIAYPFKEEFSIQFTRADEFTKKSQNLYPKDIERTLKNQALSPLMTGRMDEYLYPKDESVHPEEYYLNPVKIGNVASILDWGKGYPIIMKDYVSPIIDHKREVFGRLFTIQEQRIISDYDISRAAVRQIARYMNLFPGESLLSAIDALIEYVDILEQEQSPPQKNEVEKIGLNILGDSVDRRPVPEIDKSKVSMTDMIMDPNLIWTIISSPADYQMIDTETEAFVNYIIKASILLNHPSDTLYREDVQFERLLTDYGARGAIIAKKSDLSGLFSEPNQGELESCEEYDYGNIWGDD